MRRPAIVLVLVLAGCSTELPGVPTQHTPLRAALARVAATEVTRDYVEYADIQAIEAVTSDGPWQKLGPHRRGLLGQHNGSPFDLTGIGLFEARYRISAGHTSRAVELLAGGQDATRITTRLRANGWRDNGGELTAPPASGGSGATALAKVRATGEDVAHGQAEASLDAITTPGTTPGTATLAADPEISRLADCLGDVLAAKIIFHFPGETLRYHAAGIRRTTDRASTPHVILCSSWTSDDDADDAADRQTEAVKTPYYTDLYRNAAVERLDGDLVRLTADVPTDPSTVFADVSPKQLPGLMKKP